MAVIEANQLTRSYGDVQAVDEVSFSVEEGEIFGFLGPNGAGKTTTMHILCTLLRPTSGSARLAGYDVLSQANEVRRAIGMVFQEPSLDERLTAMENMRFHARLYDVGRDEFDHRAAELLALVELTKRADDQVETFSGGMKRRLEVARGLLHRPKVLFLDEPTLGLDPQTRRHIWGYVDELRSREGVTVFMTTHYMDEAEQCERVAIIDRGRIVALDSVEALKARVGGDVISAETSDNQAALKKLNGQPEIQARLGPMGEVILEVEAGERFIPHLVALLSNGSQPISVQSVRLRRPTLEDVFIKLTGHAMREAAPEQVNARIMRRRPR